MIETDVLIVGAGPAGSACARRLTDNGVRCLVLEKAQFPRFKPCAGWITPEVLQLLNLTPDNVPFELTHFNRFRVSLRGVKFTLPTNQYAIRRVEFDHWLARQSGSKVILHQAKEIHQEKDRFIIDHEYSSRFLVGAGGTHCPVRRTFFNQPASNKLGSLIVAMEEEFQYPIKEADCHLWFFENNLPGYAWYVPKVGKVVNVGIGGMEESLKKNGDSLKNHWELLTQKLEGMGLIQGHTYQPKGHSYYLRQKQFSPILPNVYLVGDALGLATLDMGEGIGPAIQSGQLAADAILHGKPYSVASIQRYSFPKLIRR